MIIKALAFIMLTTANMPSSPFNKESLKPKEIEMPKVYASNWRMLYEED